MSTAGGVPSQVAKGKCASGMHALQVRQVAAVTLQRGFARLRNRSALLRTRFAVRSVQSSALAMLLRRWERRFARFLTAEQARLVAGCQSVFERRERVRGTYDERQTLRQARMLPRLFDPSTWSTWMFEPSPPPSPAPLPCRSFM